MPRPEEGSFISWTFNMRIQFSVSRTADVGPRILRASAVALKNAINRSLEEAQAEQRKSMASNFVDRRRGLLNRMVKIGPDDRATDARLRGRIRIIGPEGKEDLARILTRHERGGVQLPTGGYSIDPSVRIKGFFWLPTKAIRPQFSDDVPRALYPSNLRLVERRDVEGYHRALVHRTSTGKRQLKGKRRTFVLFGAHGGAPIGVFQRSGASRFGGRGRSGGRRTLWQKGGAIQRDDIRLIWGFKSRITLKPRLHFYDVVPRTLRARLPINYAGFMTSALRATTR